MKKEEITELLKIMDENNLTALRIADGQMKIELERNASISASSAMLPLMADKVKNLLENAHEQNPLGAGAGAGMADAPEEEGIVVRSPMVGTFYTSPSPDEDAFVKVGQEVITGQTLAIVEAMKMMNEITAPEPGVITEILAGNGNQIEYNQPLFRISTSSEQSA